MKNPIKALNLIYITGFTIILFGVFLTDDFYTTGVGMIIISCGANFILWGMVLLGRKDKKSHRAAILRAQKAELEMLFSDESS